MYSTQIKTGVYKKSTVMVIIFGDFLIFDQIFLSQQVKPSVIISNTYEINELPHELSNT